MTASEFCNPERIMVEINAWRLACSQSVSLLVLQVLCTNCVQSPSQYSFSLKRARTVVHCALTHVALTHTKPFAQQSAQQWDKKNISPHLFLTMRKHSHIKFNRGFINQPVQYTQMFPRCGSDKCIRKKNMKLPIGESTRCHLLSWKIRV